jgi:hypothetical protein
MATGAFAGSGQDLLTVRPGVPPKSRAGIAAQFVAIDHSLISADTETLRIELPDGPVEYLVRDSFERRGKGNVTWRGHVMGEPDSQVVLTLKRNWVSGLIRSSLGLYEIRPGRGGGQVVEKLDTALFPECAGDRPAAGRTPGGFDALGSTSTSSSATSSDPASNIQVMALYTAQARDGAGGTAQIESVIQGAVDAANLAFEASQMTARFELVYSGLTSYNDSTDMGADLDWLQADSGVAALRDQYGADMVSLIVSSGAYCGIGFVMRDPGPGFADWAFQVTHRACAVGNLSWAHEHGHNMGFEHDPANGPNPGSASYDWSFAHFVNGSYRTVMSYSSECSLGCDRVGQFSNPAVSYNGQPTGIDGSRNNSQTGDSTASIVANFRTSASCGNGILEAGEECDGSDLGGATCSAVGCSSGAPTCTSSCTLDYSACTDCGGGGACDFDGLCEVGEDCTTCPSDCSSGSGATCGNGICEAADGEDCVSCPSDCAGKIGGKPSSRFCCGDGDGPNPVSCGDNRCSSGGFQCSAIASAGSCCGDGACDGFEDGSTCSLDCGAPPSCGDGICNGDETSCSCDLDCGSPPTTEFLLCSDGVDNDCDGISDCADGDCSGDSACSLTCEPAGVSCTSNGDCCSGSCKGGTGKKVCR